MDTFNRFVFSIKMYQCLKSTCKTKVAVVKTLNLGWHINGTLLINQSKAS